MPDSAIVFGKVFGLVIGVGLGLLLQGWAAALVLGAIGLFAGHRFDELKEAPETPLAIEDEDTDVRRRRPTLRELDDLPEPMSATELETQAQSLFAERLCGLFVAVANASNGLGRDEVRVVREFFEEGMQYGPDELDLVREALKSARDQPPSLDEALRVAREELRESELLLLVDALYRLALTDGRLRKPEREVLEQVALGLGLSEEDERSVQALHLGDGASHYERLGLTPDATDEEIKRTFRRLAATHHPDRVAHLGPGAVAIASETFRDLREAYDALKELRGF